MKAWLAGPRDSDFDTPASLLRRAGYSVWTPVSAPDDLAGSLRWTVERVLEADVVVELPGWEIGSATDVELTLATAMGVSVVNLAEALSVEPERLPA
ncbi:DUF4406 domain-containing protein [Promicromonospora kroppenstedtii]|uniref:DUF4406 domain-containing protein n=1 Tax=Promicromonospora kroppenstedtii TaxID=440482 RepID=UPI0004B8DE02|nr:DUF4406 domain-containing protein [Promicromonospora kroppenstedtii]